MILTPEEAKMLADLVRTHRFMLATAVVALPICKDVKATRNHMNQLGSINEKLDKIARLSRTCT